MIIEITSSGGFAGIPGAGIDKQINVDIQAAAMKERICAAFEPAVLKKMSAKRTKYRGADLVTYRITIVGENTDKLVFEVREDDIPPEMLDLIDEM